MEEDDNGVAALVCLGAFAVSAVGSLFADINRTELDRQALVANNELEKEALKNERYREKLVHRRALAQTAFEMKKLDIELRKCEMQAKCFDKMLEYKKYQFDRYMDLAQQKLEMLEKQREFVSAYYKEERDAMLEERKLYVERQIKANEELDLTLYSSMSSMIRKIDKNLKEILINSNAN